MLADLDAKAPTITDVAALAGVSKSTVSTVIRGAGSVSAPTRLRVLRAVEQLGYRPNTVARQLVEQRSQTLGVVAGDLDNPFNAELAALIEQAAYAAGYTTMLCTASAEALLARDLAGILSLASLDPSLDQLLGGSTPFVFVGVRPGWGQCVAIDDVEAGRLATAHLLASGRRRVAFLTTDAVEPAACRDRRQGYEAAMRTAGIDPRPTLAWTPGDRTALAAMLAADGGLQAIYASNDLAAIAILDAADDLGLRVPHDVAVAGCDDVAAARLHRIALTTVAQPLPELARSGIAALAALAAGQPGGDVTLGCRLVVRGSG